MTNINNLNRITNGEIVTVTYDPNGMSNMLQRDITNLLDRIIKDSGSRTLSEMGYIHCNTLNFVNGSLDLAIYFDADLASEYKRENMIQSNTVRMPKDDFNIFENYLFAGNINHCVSFEKMNVPKYKVNENEAGNASISIKDDSNKVTEKLMMVIHCNVNLVMAAILNINLTDINYHIEFNTIGKTGKNINQTFVNMGTGNYPVSISVSFTDPDNNDEFVGYDTSSVIPYLMKMFEQSKTIQKNQTKLEQKVSEKADKKKKKDTKKKYKGFSKFC